MADKETQPQEPLQQSEVQQAAQQQQQPQAQQAAQESQGPRYRYNENMVNWEELERSESQRLRWNSRDSLIPC